MINQFHLTPNQRKLDSTGQDMLADSFGSMETFCKVFFPDRFNLPFSTLHRDMFQILDDQRIQKFVIAAPRGFGKTTIYNLAFPAHNILFGESKLIVPISNSAEGAITFAEDLKRELISNETILQLFGNLKSNNWSKLQWETSNGVMVVPRGAGAQIRGIRYGKHRPDFIPIDDVENREEVKNDARRADRMQWLLSDVMNSIDTSSSLWRIGVIGTILHEDSLLMKLVEDPAWESLVLEICGDNYESNWPEKLSNGAIQEMVAEHRRRNELDIFYMEYRNMPISTETAIFKSQYFKYYSEQDAEFKKLLLDGSIESVVIVDPAKTVKKTSADTAIVCLGVDIASNRIYLRDSRNEKFHPHEMFDAMFDMCERNRARVLGVEVTSLNEFITHPIENEIRRRGLNIELVELKPRGSKEERVAALSSYYRQGLIYHNSAPGINGALESQLMAFPKARRWDVMDAMAYIVPMMEAGSKYFLNEGKEDSYESVEAEFAELDAIKEEPVMADWREF